MSAEGNEFLEFAEEVYKKIDQNIVQAYFKGRSIESIGLEVWRHKPKDIPPVFFDLINKEIRFFSEERSIEDARDFYRDNYPLYFFGWYSNLPETLLLLENTQPGEVLLDPQGLEIKNTGEDTEEMQIEDFINRVLATSKKFGIPQKEVEEIRVKETKTNAANYDNRSKTIFINPDIRGTRSLYVVLHELMHHFNFTAMDDSIYVSDYDYGAGFREGIAISMSEKLIMSEFRFLEKEHKLYIKFCKERGKASYYFYKKGLTKEEYVRMLSNFGFSNNVLETQFVSCLKFPAYKEGYYPFYCALKERDLSKIIRMPNRFPYELLKVG